MLVKNFGNRENSLITTVFYSISTNLLTDKTEINLTYFMLKNVIMKIILYNCLSVLSQGKTECDKLIIHYEVSYRVR